MTVEIEHRDDIGLIWLNNPPVNAISSVLARGLIQAVEALNADARTRVIVLACRGRTFVAGADIKEFDPANRPEGGFPDTRSALDNSRKPIVAALHGTALGGGFELALCCDWRVATPDARVGLPEVTLGVLPGGGGTQLLPRLMGVPAALQAMLTGRMIPAPEAQRLGAVDHLAGGDLTEAAVAFARAVSSTRRRSCDLPVTAPEPGTFDTARKTAAPGQTAPQRIIDCVEAAVTLTYAQGTACEWAKFEECLDDPQSGALQHSFFAHRQIGKIPGLSPDIKPAPIQRAAVVGAGTMGGGIVLSIINAGVPVTVLETSPEALDRGLARIHAEIDAARDKGRLTADTAEARKALVTGTLDYADFAQADLVIEAVFESIEVKHAVFRELDAVMRPGAILATNTSALSIDEIAAVTSRPGSVVGMHFFSPANVMRLCEVVRGDSATSPATLATAVEFARRIGKVPVVAGNCFGFIGNRMVFSYLHQAELLLLEGATPAQVDRALTAWGMAMGPFQMIDLAGIDVGWRARLATPDAPRDARACRVQDLLAEQGRFGQKTRGGYYDYPEGRKPVTSAAVEALIRDVAADFGYQRREISDREIVERCLLALFNTGCDILAEGHAWRSGDIDVVYLDGYGFPAWRGGPMYWAERTLGLDRALVLLREHQDRTGTEWMRVSPALEQLVAVGGRLSDITPR